MRRLSSGSGLTFRLLSPIILAAMLGSIGFQEIAVILGIALLIFGPRKLPEIGKTLGRSLGEFRRATSELKRSIEEEVRNIPEEDDKTSS